MSSVSLNKEPRKLKNGQTVEYYYLRWYGSDGRRRAKSIGRTDGISKTKAGKIRLRKMAELEVHPGRVDITKGPQLGEYIQHFIQVREADLEPATISGYEYATNHAIEYFGPGCLMGRISKPEARGYKASLAKSGLSRWSVETYVTRIKTVFEQAVDDELILRNPFRGLSKTVKADRDWHYVTKQEFQALLQTAQNGWREILALCRLAGLRRAEAFHMEEKFIDRKNKRLRVIGHGAWNPKTKKSRVVPIFKELQEILSGQKIKSTILSHPNRDFKVLCRRAGVEPWSSPFQSMRKSCARDWAQQFPSHVTREWMGHTSLNTTDKYYLQVPPSEYQRASKS